MFVKSVAGKLNDFGNCFDKTMKNYPCRRLKAAQRHMIFSKFRYQKPGPKKLGDIKNLNKSQSAAIQSTGQSAVFPKNLNFSRRTELS